MSASTVLDAWKQCDLTDTLFVLVCTVFCWPIIPAVGLAYSGYSHRRNGMASFMPGILSIGVCTVQWFVIGYSFAYGEGSGVIGDFKYAFHRGVLSEPVGTIPAILFSEFQLVFEATVCAIAVGGACERGRTLPLIPFIFVSPPCNLGKYRLMSLTALGNLHLLPPSPYGLVRNWLPRQPRRVGLRRRNPCSRLLIRHRRSIERLPLVPTLPLQEICNPYTLPPRSPPPGKLL